MDLGAFNNINATQKYTYRKNPLHETSFMILKRQEAQNTFEPVGEYTVLDRSEEFDITEKKVMNLVSRLNGQDKIIDLSDHIHIRTLHHKAVDGAESGDKSKIVFYTLGEEGVSKENAVLTFAGGLNDDIS